MVINGIHAQIQSLAVDTQKQCNQLFSQHTVDMNILMLYVSWCHVSADTACLQL